MMMNLRDQLSSLFWLAISIFVCSESIRSRVGTLRSPGPGFLPFWSGIVLGSFAIIQLARCSLKKKGQEKAIGLGWLKSRVIWVLFSFFLYLLLLPVIGYLITTFGLMTFLLAMMARSRSWVQGVSALIIVSASYFIFAILLGLKLPKGIFGF